MARDFKNFPPVRDVFFPFEYELKFIPPNRVPRLGGTFLSLSLDPKYTRVKARKKCEITLPEDTVLSKQFGYEPSTTAFFIN